MAPLVVALVLASALLHAGWNALLKRTRDPEIAAVAMMGMSAAFAVASALVLRAPMPPSRAFAWTVASGLLEAGYVVTLSRALSKAPLGIVYTVARGGSLLAVWPISLVWLGEPWSVAGLAGAVLVTTGLGATAWADNKARPERGAGVGVLWAASSAVFIAGYVVCYKLALSSGGTPGASVAISLSIAAVGSALRLGGRLRLVPGIVRASLGAVVLTGFLANLSFLLFLFALERGGTGALATLRNTSIVFAQGFAWMLGERPRRLSVAGAVVVTAGAILLAWPHR